MTTWTRAELDRIENAEELQIASLRGDGTLRKPVTIWVVRVGNDLYVRSVNKQIDDAYRTKYRRYAESIIDHINSSAARAATIKLIPRSIGELQEEPSTLEE